MRYSAIQIHMMYGNYPHNEKNIKSEIVHNRKIFKAKLSQFAKRVYIYNSDICFSKYRTRFESYTIF